MRFNPRTYAEYPLVCLREGFPVDQALAMPRPAIQQPAKIPARLNLDQGDRLVYFGAHSRRRFFLYEYAHPGAFRLKKAYLRYQPGTYVFVDDAVYKVLYRTNYAQRVHLVPYGDPEGRHSSACIQMETRKVLDMQDAQDANIAEFMRRKHATPKSQI